MCPRGNLTARTALAAALAALGSANASAAAADRANLLLGSWTCRSGAGSMATHVYARNADGSLSMHNRFVRRVGGPATSLDETYRFDPAAQTWKLSITGTPFFGRFEGAAAPWTGDAWIFAGSESLPAPNGFLRRDEVQLVYVDRFPDGFERDFFANVGGRWVPYSDESCTRSPSSG